MSQIDRNDAGAQAIGAIFALPLPVNAASPHIIHVEIHEKSQISPAISRTPAASPHTAAFAAALTQHPRPFKNFPITAPLNSFWVVA